MSISKIPSPNIIFYRRQLMPFMMNGVRFLVGEEWNPAGASGRKQVPVPCASEELYPVAAGDVVIFTINIYRITLHNAEGKYVDFFTIRDNGTKDTQGRAVRQVTNLSSWPLWGLAVLLHDHADVYIYNITQQRYIIKGDNIPDDYIPQIQT